MDDDKILAYVELKQSDTEEPVPGTLYLTFVGFAFVPHKSNRKATFLLTYDKIRNHKFLMYGSLDFFLKAEKDDGPSFEFETWTLRDLTRNVVEIFMSLYRRVGDKPHPEQCMPDAEEMARRAYALNADIHLKKLHDELAVTETLTESEFWAATKTWLGLLCLEIPNAETRSHTEGHSQFAGAHSGTTDTENSATALQVISTDEPSGLSGDTGKYILTKIGEAEMNMEAKLEAETDKIEAKLGARIDKVEEKLESIGIMLAAFIAKQDSDNLEAGRSEVTQIADASKSALVDENLDQTKAIFDLYFDEHHQKILQSGLSRSVKEEILFDNILADTLMACFDKQKPLDDLFAFYKAGLLRNAMTDVQEKLKNRIESPDVAPFVNPLKERLSAAISQFNEFVREERRKTNKRVKKDWD